MENRARIDLIRNRRKQNSGQRPPTQFLLSRMSITTKHNPRIQPSFSPIKSPLKPLITPTKDLLCSSLTLPSTSQSLFQNYQTKKHQKQENHSQNQSNPIQTPSCEQHLFSTIQNEFWEFQLLKYSEGEIESEISIKRNFCPLPFRLYTRYRTDFNTLYSKKATNLEKRYQIDPKCFKAIRCNSPEQKKSKQIKPRKRCAVRQKVDNERKSSAHISLPNIVNTNEQQNKLIYARLGTRIRKHKPEKLSTRKQFRTALRAHSKLI